MNLFLNVDNIGKQLILALDKLEIFHLDADGAWGTLLVGPKIIVMELHSAVNFNMHLAGGRDLVPNFSCQFPLICIRICDRPRTAAAVVVCVDEKMVILSIASKITFPGLERMRLHIPHNKIR